MSKFKMFVIAAIVAIVSGCATSTAKVNFDKNEAIDTSHYQTFAWLTEEKVAALPAGFNPITKTRLDKAIEQAFIDKGYVLTDDAESADFAISYTVGSREKIRVDSYPTTYRTGFGWGRGYYGGIGMPTETHVRTYTEGRVAIDIFDVKTHQPAWHGWGEKRVSSSYKDNPEAAIKAVVDQVIGQFNPLY